MQAQINKVNSFKLNVFPRKLRTLNQTVQVEKRRNILYLLADHAGRPGPGPKAYLGSICTRTGNIISTFGRSSAVDVLLDHHGKLHFKHGDDYFGQLEVEVILPEETTLTMDAITYQHRPPLIKKMHIGNPEQKTLTLSVSSLTLWREVTTENIPDTQLGDFSLVEQPFLFAFGFDGKVTVGQGILPQNIAAALGKLQQEVPRFVHLTQEPDLGENFLCQHVNLPRSQVSYSILTREVHLSGLNIGIRGNMDLASFGLHWNLVFNWGVKE
ncbi:MAG: hypothetical protein KKB81_05515 [Candidatus Margulisbacteria bacterium]|nr:hypothetical protein [Candidatus Margulisiibacteriota bacterium]MBU1021281.1 hypothetical protein [Candidatus Margulisiibacteriota bacterium]MBU1729230.1 hypothetical protein [Candidatus Margulisiibacteriota bacterium]MBU1954903.1 hypothetical protein [Candidatus Margulisiibacteriota bacterium]